MVEGNPLTGFNQASQPRLLRNNSVLSVVVTVRAQTIGSRFFWRHSLWHLRLKVRSICQNFVMNYRAWITYWQTLVSLHCAYGFLTADFLTIVSAMVLLSAVSVLLPSTRPCKQGRWGHHNLPLQHEPGDLPCVSSRPS